MAITLVCMAFALTLCTVACFLALLYNWRTLDYAVGGWPWCILGMIRAVTTTL